MQIVLCGLGTAGAAVRRLSHARRGAAVQPGRAPHHLAPVRLRTPSSLVSGDFLARAFADSAALPQLHNGVVAAALGLHALHRALRAARRRYPAPPPPAACPRVLSRLPGFSKHRVQNRPKPAPCLHRRPALRPDAAHRTSRGSGRGVRRGGPVSACSSLCAFSLFSSSEKEPSRSWCTDGGLHTLPRRRRRPRPRRTSREQGESRVMKMKGDAEALCTHTHSFGVPNTSLFSVEPRWYPPVPRE
eukprot:COSAG04_NODE_1507_length_6504_cov_1.860734_8_plen_245_part_00